MAKVNITMSDDLLEKIDEYCEKNYTNRSAFLSTCANKYLRSFTMAKLARSLTNALVEIKNTETIDEDIKKEIEDLKIYCDTVTRWLDKE